MSKDIQIITGPPTSKVSKAQAEEGLKNHKYFPKGASYKINEAGGRWIAAIVASEPPQFGGDDSSDDKPKDDAPFGGSSDDNSSSDSSDDSSSDDSSNDEPKDDKPSSEEGPKEDSSKGGELGEIKDMLQTLFTALGIDPAGDAGLGPDAPSHDDPLGPGADAPPVEMPPEPSGGEGIGTPSSPGGAKHIVHEHALKPGETPPGGTPIGAPSFSSVNKIAADHPWAEMAAKGFNEFVVQERIGAAPLAEIHAELEEYARTAGYRVKQLNQSNDSEGHRIAKAVIGK